MRQRSRMANHSAGRLTYGSLALASARCACRGSRSLTSGGVARTADRIG
jgi:hypothetical protein